MFFRKKGSLRNSMFCLFLMCIFLAKGFEIAECAPIKEDQFNDSGIKYSDLIGEDVEQAQKAVSEENINSNEISNDVENFERIARKVEYVFYITYFSI
jgi:hypothetical protein